jgi:hypothetical protein
VQNNTGPAAGRNADLCLHAFAGEQVERTVSGTLRVGRLYGYHIIVSSTSAVPLALDVLAQVPQVLHWFRNTRKRCFFVAELHVLDCDEDVLRSVL